MKIQGGMLLLGGVFFSRLLASDMSLDMLEKEMRKTIWRQEIIAQNLANKDVPGYIPIRTEEELDAIFKQTRLVTADRVIQEEEMAKMTKNRMRHQALIRFYNMKMEMLRKVINQGK